MLASPLTSALQAFGRRIPFAFLDDIRDKFLSAYGPEAAQYAVAYEYNTEFSGMLQQRMRYFANDPNADAINRVRGGVAEVKNIMVENIEKVCSLSYVIPCFAKHCPQYTRNASGACSFQQQHDSLPGKEDGLHHICAQQHDRLCLLLRCLNVVKGSSCLLIRQTIFRASHLPSKGMLAE